MCGVPCCYSVVGTRRDLTKALRILITFGGGHPLVQGVSEKYHDYNANLHFSKNSQTLLLARVSKFTWNILLPITLRQMKLFMPKYGHKTHNSREVELNLAFVTTARLANGGAAGISRFLISNVSVCMRTLAHFSALPKHHVLLRRNR